VTIGALIAALERRGAMAAPPRLPEALAARRASAVVYDSSRAVPGAVFVGVRGRNADGAAFAPQAVARGAVVVVAESPAPAGLDAPWITVPNARVALASLAAELYDHPSRQLRLVGITGTNGKTTSAYLMRSVLQAAGERAGLLGTVVYSIGREDREAVRTTPEAPDLQAMLREMVDNGCASAVMEVSSHALALGRADELTFAAGLFTNLTRDHLDFHGDMQSYGAAKRRLFEMLPAGAPGVVNADDPKSAYFLEAAKRPVTFAVRRAADVSPRDVSLTLEGLAFDVATPAGTVRVRSSLVGQPNVYNILGVVATAVALHVPVGAIEAGITALPGVPGRFQVVSGAADDIGVVVDYAHTDDALKNLLETARTLAAGRLVTVFGCGGDRDRTKRPLMGAVASRLSDQVIVTSDNPRSEDPARIVEEVLRGMPVAAERPDGTRAAEVQTVVDRRAAIDLAIDRATPGDLVIVAGKGHEKTQTIGERVIKFDDVEVARAALARRRSRARVV
jgi:UDP-N-acetylmuramoyl-L-alanyl-D-glutamate--2,6-diaminopimelate ligase